MPILCDLLDKESLQRLLVGLLGDPVRAKIAKEATSILKFLFWDLSRSFAQILLHTPEHYGNIRCFNYNRFLFGHMARESIYNQRPSLFIYRVPRRGSEAVRISLAFEVSDHSC